MDMSDQPEDRPSHDGGEDHVYRHGRMVRLTHWTNAILILALLLTGFGISQLHLPIYWGDAGQDWGPGIQEFNAGKVDPYPAIARAPEMPWQDLRTRAGPRAAGLGIGTWFNDMLYSAEDYLRNPSRVRDHIFLAWLFLFNGLVYLAAGLWTGRFQGLLRPSRRDLSWRLIRHELWSHVRLRFPKGDEARSYNVIQKYTYLTMIFLVLPLQLLTGLGLMPWMDAAFPWFKDLFFGRQSMRTIHFACSFLILGFLIVHLAMVLLSGFRNNIRSMITGWYRLPR